MSIPAHFCRQRCRDAPSRAKAVGLHPAAIPSAPFPPFVQAKLRIGPPADRFEQEADHVAEKIMHTPMPSESVAPMPTTRAIDKQPAASTISCLGNGRPLDRGERAFFEPRFLSDLGRVRLHNGPAAAQSAGAIQARAFTIGQHIAFGEGQYHSETNAGKRLLAHELAHTIQQQGTHSPLIQRAEHRAQENYFDPDNCWVPGETKGPTTNVIGQFIGILEVPETCAGDIRMTMRFETVGGWSLDFWLSSPNQLIFTTSATGIDPASLVHGKTIITDAFFEYTVSYPLTPENCAANFDVYLLMTYRRQPNQKPNFAEVKFSRRATWDKALIGSTLVDSSPAPTVRVDSCGRLEPTGKVTPGAAPQ
ncbi:MAG TPA: DUF4157 domain-containing protein [Chthoniobacterales bacterium]